MSWITARHGPSGLGLYGESKLALKRFCRVAEIDVKTQGRDGTVDILRSRARSDGLSWER